jgi:hypothetical protein
MATTLTANFDTRREAEMTVERLVQEHGLDRAKILIAAAGDENTAGEEVAGSDTQSAEPSPERRDDAALNGQVMVSVEVADDAAATAVREAFSEFDAEDVAAK